MSTSASMHKRAYIIFAICFCVILAFIMYLSYSRYAHEPMMQFVTSSQARVKLIEHRDAFILDVRSSEEFYASRIQGAVNIPYLAIREEESKLPQDRHAPLFVYCRTGRRAAIAANELLDLGFSNIIVFPGMATWDYETVSG